MTDDQHPLRDHSFFHKRKSKSSCSMTVSPPSSPVCVSAPPPTIVNQLDVFLKFSGESKHEDLTAGEKLHKAWFMPETISEANVTLDHLKELTGFAEGELHALKKFAYEWSSKISEEGKVKPLKVCC